jgi:hypothetical protein
VDNRKPTKTEILRTLTPTTLVLLNRTAKAAVTGFVNGVLAARAIAGRAAIGVCAIMGFRYEAQLDLLGRVRDKGPLAHTCRLPPA